MLLLFCIWWCLLQRQCMLCGHYLQQAEHSVAYVEAVPPVVVGDGTVTLPHCVHPSGQRLGKRDGVCSESRVKKKTRHGHDLVWHDRVVQGNPPCLLHWVSLKFATWRSVTVFKRLISNCIIIASTSLFPAKPSNCRLPATPKRVTVEHLQIHRQNSWFLFLKHQDFTVILCFFLSSLILH